jgi:hypothetical protein
MGTKYPCYKIFYNVIIRGRTQYKYNISNEFAWNTSDTSHADVWLLPTIINMQN